MASVIVPSPDREPLLDIVCSTAAWATYRVMLTPFDRIKILLQVAPEFPLALATSHSIEQARCLHPAASGARMSPPVPNGSPRAICAHEVERLVHVFRMFDAIPLLPHYRRTDLTSRATTATAMVPNSGAGPTAAVEEALAAVLRAPRSLVSGADATIIPTAATSGAAAGFHPPMSPPGKGVTTTAADEAARVSARLHAAANAASTSGGCVTWMNCARYIYRTEGVAGFFRGGGLAAVAQVAQTVAVVTLGSGMRWVLAAASADPDPRARPVAAMFVSALSALVAALGVSVAMYPLDLARFIRMADLRVMAPPVCPPVGLSPTSYAASKSYAISTHFEHPRTVPFLREVVGGKFAPSCIHPHALVQAWSAAATRDEVITAAADGTRATTRSRVVERSSRFFSTADTTARGAMQRPLDFWLRGGGACLYRGFGLTFTTLALQRALFFFTYDAVARVVLPMAERADAARLERWAHDEERRLIAGPSVPASSSSSSDSQPTHGAALPRPPRPLPPILIEGVVTFAVAALGTALLHPLDTLRCRYVRRGYFAANSVAHGAFGRYDAAVQSPWAQAAEIAKREGIRSFYRGFGFTVFVRSAWMTAAGLCVPRLAQSFKTQVRHVTTAAVPSS